MSLNLPKPSFLWIALGGPCLAIGCATAPVEPGLEAQRQAELVGAPAIDPALMCSEDFVKRSQTKLSADVAQAGDAWVLFTYDLDGSGKARNISAQGSQYARALGKLALKDLQDSVFKTGTVRTGCKMLVTVSVR